MLEQWNNSHDITCQQSYAESHSAQTGYVHGASSGNIPGRFQERQQRYMISNRTFNMDNLKIDRIPATNLYVLYRLL